MRRILFSSRLIAYLDMLIQLATAAAGLVHGLRPTFFTCRHTYEAVLQDEIVLRGPASPASCTSPLPGLVRVAEQLPSQLDPVYALQVLPKAVEVRADSVKTLATAVVDALMESADDVEALSRAPRGSLAVHELVPGMLKGTPKPALSRRCGAIATAVTDQLRSRYPCARPLRATDPEPEEHWLLQLLLLEPEVLVGSLCRAEPVPVVGGSWPCHHLAAGLASVDLEGDVPSSAYRKLLEALACCRTQPHPASTVYDLGASPGGWSTALRRLGCRVIAVDRSPLSRELMADELVRFEQGDAFTFTPEAEQGGSGAGEAAVWMVSDVIAYPERVTELLERWCGGGWAQRMVVTMKFQGDTPDWDELQVAIDRARELGFACRAKHFFSNKNEVTLMLARL